MLIQNGRLAIRELLAEDKFLLAKWLSDPEVLQFYEGRDRPLDMVKVEEDFFGEADNETRCLIIYDDAPIGYIQFYPVGEEERQVYGYSNLAEVLYGMDQFIGEPAYWNKGIGTQLIESVVAYLLTEKGADRIVMDPQTWNERAIRCYEKCRFEKVKLLPKHEWHEGEYRDCWLIEYVRGKGIQLRNRGSAIIIESGKVAVIKRRREGQEYYVFPGGGIEEGESPEQATIPEAFEELGVHIEIKESIGTVHFNGVQQFFLSAIIGGTFGTGSGEEYEEDRNRGSYEPMWLPIDKLVSLDVRPMKIAEMVTKLVDTDYR